MAIRNYGNVLTKPKKLSHETIEHACEILRAGNYINTTCDMLCIARGTWANWNRRGEELLASMEKDPLFAPMPEDELYIEFITKTKKASSEAVVANLENIRKAGVHDWKASAWFLERRHADMFGSNQRIVIESDDNGLSVDEIRETLKQLKANS